MKSVRIAISLPGSLLDRIERLRLDLGLSRSALLRHAVERLLEDQDRRQRISEYVEGYRRQPEGRDEIDAADASAADSLAGNEWE